jgi:hypothetical protein
MFNDVILVARHLGLRSLWIDSLCIIQDNQDDWAAQSALMCDVYKYAAVTLVAEDAADGSVGLLESKSQREERTTLQVRAVTVI